MRLYGALYKLRLTPIGKTLPKTGRKESLVARDLIQVGPLHEGVSPPLLIPSFKCVVEAVALHFLYMQLPQGSQASSQKHLLMDLWASDYHKLL